MQNQNKIIQLLGIPFTALLSIIFGMLLISFPTFYVVFESDIGDDIHYDYPITHLDIFNQTDFYQSPIDVSIGDCVCYFVDVLSSYFCNCNSWT